MQNIRHILVREFVERVRTKAFLITTLLTPVLMGLLIVLPMYLATRGANQKTRVIVAETGPKAGTVCALMQQRQSRTDKAAEVAPPMSNEKIGARQQQSARQLLELTPAVVEPGHEAETRRRLDQDVLAKRGDAVLWIDGDPAAGGKVDYADRSASDFITRRAVQDLLSAAVVQRRLEARGLDAGEIESLVKPIEVTPLKINKSGSRQEDKGVGAFSSYVFVMLLYMTLLIWGITVMRGVIEEKGSRVFEVLLSVVKPFDLMAGKIFGIAAVGLVQYAI